MQPIPSVVPNGFSDPPEGSGPSALREQDLRWRACGNGLTCTTVLAPLDYAKPDGTAITLALARREATSEPRLGTLFINPGGPGGSGHLLRRLLQPDRAGGLRHRRLGSARGRGTRPRSPAWATRSWTASTRWTPRRTTRPRSGCGQRRCWPSVDPAWNGRAGCCSTCRRWRRSRTSSFCAGWSATPRSATSGRRTGPGSGPCTPSSIPERVGRMVLDGSVNISGSDTISQTEGFERALNNFATWCAQERCRLGESKAAVIERVEAYLDELDRQPLPVGEPDTDPAAGGRRGLLLDVRRGAQLAAAARCPGRGDVRPRRAGAADAGGPVELPAWTTAAMTRSTTRSPRCGAWTARTRACVRWSSATSGSARPRRCSAGSAGRT